MNQPFRILIVDDEYAVRYLLTATLRDCGYEVATAESGPAAIQALEAVSFDLVLTDLRMPGMSGLELASWIRDRFPQLVFIVMTGYGSVDSAAEAVRLGAFDYLLKPFGDMELVRASIDRALQRLKLTERLDRSIEDLRASRARFEGIVESSSDGILIVDASGIIRFANTSARTLLGRDGELVGSALSHSPSVGKTIEVDILRPGNERGVAEMQLDETDWESLPASLVTLRDITERKHAEQALQEAHWRLQQADVIQKQFLSMVSHDLHTPIHIVLGALEQLLAGPGQDLRPEQRRMLELAQRSALRQSRLVDDLVYLTRLDEGAPKTTVREIDLREVVQHAVEEAELLPQRKDLKLDLELPAHPILVQGEADRLVQLVTNLISNGLRFAATRVSVGLSATAAQAQVVVDDDGPGVPLQERERIFERFVRLQPGRGGAGAGLGLAIVRAIAQTHGGSVRVEACPGEGLGCGARFVVALPVPASEASSGQSGR